MANLLSGAACSFKISDGLAGSMRSMRSMSVVTGDGCRTVTVLRPRAMDASEFQAVFFSA
jgi:hypothetical protein